MLGTQQITPAAFQAQLSPLQSTDHWLEVRLRSPDLDPTKKIEKPVTFKGGMISFENKPGLPAPTPPQDAVVQQLSIAVIFQLMIALGNNPKEAIACRKELKLNQEQRKKVAEKRHKQLEEAQNAKESAHRWSIGIQVFSWTMALQGIISGAVLVATGVATVPGVLLIIASGATLALQMTELFGGMEKIAKLLPSNDSEKKQATILWMKIGFHALCLALAGVAIILGGYSQVGKAAQSFSMMIGAIAGIARGVCTGAQGVDEFRASRKRAAVTQSQIELTKLDHRREDLSNIVEQFIKQQKQNFEFFGRLLGFNSEMFQASQAINRR